MKYIMILALVFTLSSCKCGSDDQEQTGVFEMMFGKKSDHLQEVQEQTGVFEKLFGKKSDHLQEIPEQQVSPEEKGGKYWQAWLEEYSCTFDQLELVEAEMNVCISGDYKKEYCYANAKRSYCDRNID